MIFNQNNCCYQQQRYGPCCARGERGPRGVPGPPGPTGPTLSSFIEAVGITQNVLSQANVAFQADSDIAGSDMRINAGGEVITITRAGLYHVEWSLNLDSAVEPVLLCLIENGVESSALGNTMTQGNLSSGALINVLEGDLPLTVSLRNCGGDITLTDSVGTEGTAASIRILRFADGPTV